MDRRNFLIAAAGAALAAGLAPAPLRADTPQKLTVLLDWFVNPDHATLVLARERGFFAEAELEVELVPPTDPAAPPRLVAAKQADIAVSYQPNLYLQVEEGLPVARIGTLVATPLNCLVVPADGPVKTIADLKGRTVGFSVAGLEEALLGAMLKSAGLTMADVTLVNVNFALTQSLMAGKVDAVIGAFRNFELAEMALAGRVARAFQPEEHGVPAYDELILLSHQDRIGDKALRRFIDAIERAALALLNDPDGSWKLFLKAYPALDDALDKAAWTATLPRFAQSPAALDTGRYERFGVFLREAGVVKKDLPALASYAVELAR